jgi:hypothetical protein
LLQEPCALELTADTYDQLLERLQRLEQLAKHALQLQGFTEDRIVSEWHLNLRFRYTVTALLLPTSVTVYVHQHCYNSSTVKAKLASTVHSIVYRLKCLHVHVILAILYYTLPDR